MQSKSDAQLLGEYAGQGTESSFAEIVHRHTNLVYSAALRQVDSPAVAAEIAQSVFLGLARGAQTLSPRLAADASLAGWLCRSARNLSLNFRRDEFRRNTRERQAMEQFNSTPDAAPDWERLRLVLDEAMSDLSEADYDALVLRFYNNQDLRSVGEALGVSEDTAQKRISRALEKLREHLSRRDVSTTAAALAGVISANAVHAAPVGLTITISTAAMLSGTSLATTATATATKVVAMTTLQKTVIGAVLAAAVGTGIYEARQISRLRGEVQKQQGPLVAQIAQLKSDNEGLSNRLAQANESLSHGTGRLRELLRLRGEVGLLRRQQRELERAVAAAQSKTHELPGQSASGVTPHPTRPLPFQLQLVLDEPGDNTEAITNNASSAKGETLHVLKTPLMDYTAISSATVTRNASSAAPEISIEFSPEGKELFAAITKENLNKRLAIVLDGHLYSAPVIRSEISGGKAQINGSFSEAEARDLAAKINEAISGQ